jgi:aspartate aminotransferase-like enzyme
MPTATAAAGIHQPLHETMDEFVEAMAHVGSLLRQVIGDAAEVILLAASATGAFEAAVQNVVRTTDRVLVPVNGVFAARWAALLEAYGVEVVVAPVPPGDKVTPGHLGRALDADPGLSAVVLVHCETSTGAVSDVEALAHAARGRLVVVDAVSTVGAVPIAMGSSPIDVVIGAGQKALMTPPGLSFVGLSERALRRTRHDPQERLPGFYFSWADLDLDGTAAARHMPWTPPVTLTVQLLASLELLVEEGLPAVHERHRRLGAVARAGVTALGLPLLSPADDSSSVITAFRPPPGVTVPRVQTALAAQRVRLAGGAGLLEGEPHVLRIGHCGAVDEYDVLCAIAALERALAACGVDVVFGTAVAAAQRAAAATDPAPPLPAPGPSPGPGPGPSERAPLIAAPGA